MSRARGTNTGCETIISSRNQPTQIKLSLISILTYYATSRKDHIYTHARTQHPTSDANISSTFVWSFKKRKLICLWILLFVYNACRSTLCFQSFTRIFSRCVALISVILFRSNFPFASFDSSQSGWERGRPRARAQSPWNEPWYKCDTTNLKWKNTKQFSIRKSAWMAKDKACAIRCVVYVCFEQTKQAKKSRICSFR